MRNVITIQNVYTKKTETLCKKCITKKDNFQVQHGSHRGYCDNCDKDQN